MSYHVVLNVVKRQTPKFELIPVCVIKVNKYLISQKHASYRLSHNVDISMNNRLLRLNFFAFLTSLGV